MGMAALLRTQCRVLTPSDLLMEVLCGCAKATAPSPAADSSVYDGGPTVSAREPYLGSVENTVHFFNDRLQGFRGCAIPLRKVRRGERQGNRRGRALCKTSHGNAADETGPRKDAQFTPPAYWVQN